MKSRQPRSADAEALAGVSPADRARYRTLLQQIREADRDEKGGWDRKWEAVDEVLVRGLFVLSEQRDAKAWCKAVLGTSYRNASRNARVARHFTVAHEQSYPIEKLDALIGRLERQNGGSLPRGFKMQPDAVRVSVRRDGGTKRVGLLEASEAEIRRSPRDADPKRGLRRSPVEQLFVTALRGSAALADITVRVNDGRLWLGGIPLTQLDRTLSALRALDWRSATDVVSTRVKPAPRTKRKPRR